MNTGAMNLGAWRASDVGPIFIDDSPESYTPGA